MWFLAYTVRIGRLALKHLGSLRAFDRRRILDAMSNQLAHEPTKWTTHRKQLVGLSPAFEHVQPVWQLRVGDHRVIYDVDDDAMAIIVRAVLKKGRRTTKEIT